MGAGSTDGGAESMREVRNDVPAPPRRLAKSTLTLIPLLGTHEVIFAFVMDEHARGVLRFVKLFTELSFTSFQVTSRRGPQSRSPRVGAGRDQPAPPRGSLGPGLKAALPQGTWVEQSQSPRCPDTYPVFSVSALDKKPSWMLPWAPSLA